MKLLNYVLFLISVFFMAESAKAQDITPAYYEGYVFSAKTLKPLANASVGFRELLSSGENYEGTNSNSDGFYSIGWGSVVTVTLYLEVSCKVSSSKTVSKRYMLVPPLRTEFLNQRNFYLNVPEKTGGCIKQ